MASRQLSLQSDHHTLHPPAGCIHIPSQQRVALLKTESGQKHDNHWWL